VAAEVDVRLLGEPGLVVDGELVHALTAPRLMSLLGLLIVYRGTPLVRRRVAFALWPDSTEAQARTNLRRALHQLKRAVPDAERHLDVNGATLGWRLDSPARVDLVRLEETSRCDGDDWPALRRAVEAYGGDLLPNCYDDWVAPVRERLRLEQVERLERLGDHEEDIGDTAAAISAAQQLLLVDPLHEPSYRRLIRLYGNADRARAVRAYHVCASTLERELGVAPSRDTVGLYERLLADVPPERTPQPATAAVHAVRMVGREHEWAGLLAEVRAALEGRCRLVLIHGEAGIGKSRLAAEVVAWCERQLIATAVSRAYEAEGRLPFAPLAEVLRSATVRPALDRLDGVWLDELVRLVPDRLPDRVAAVRPAMLDGSERTRLFNAVGQAFHAVGRPLVVVVDDLQWCDVETMEVLHFLVRTSPAMPLLIVAAARDEGLDAEPVAAAINGLRSIDALTDVALGRLAPADAADVVSQVMGDKADPDAVQRVVTEADGNPLFLVEMARSTVDPSAGLGRMPKKVQAVIESRLAGLTVEGRLLADVVAVAGRHVDVELLIRLVPSPEVDVTGALDELWRRGILVEAGADGYDFGHDRIRDVVDAGIGPARRRLLHRQVADALVATRVGPSRDQVEAAIAVHYERAGVVTASLEHYHRAIEVAGRVFAHDEVITLAHRALELLGRLPDGTDRVARELAILGPLAVAVYNGPGMTTDNQYLFDRINVLRADGGHVLDPTVLRITANSAVGQRAFNDTDEIGAVLIARSAADGDVLLLTEGHYLRGIGGFWLGRLADSAAHLEAALAAYDPSRVREHLERFGQDPGAVCLVRMGLTCWHLGRLDDAERCRDEGRARADAIGHRWTAGYAQVFAAWEAVDAGALDVVDDLTGAPAADGNAFVSLATVSFGAWARAIRSGSHDAIGQLARCAEEAVRSQPFLEPKILLLLADALRCVGQPAEGLDAARRGRTIAVREIPILAAEAWRIEAELLAATGAAPEAVTDALEQAMSVATGQGAVMLRRRAVATAAACGVTIGTR
jgi:DNA-binding SARP family transcriptional activator